MKLRFGSKFFFKKDNGVSAFQEQKTLVRAYQAALDTSPAGQSAQAIAPFMVRDLDWRGMHPFHEQAGPQAVAELFWDPLKRAMGPLQRRPDIFIAGQSEKGDAGAVWVVEMGQLMGNWMQPWLDIPATRKLAFLRYAEFNRVEDGQIVQSAFFCDILHMMRQAGIIAVPHQTGQFMIAPGPRGGGGLLYDAQDAGEGAQTLYLIDRMCDNINVNRTRFASFEDELADTWTRDMIWSGPTGIGASYTIPRYIEQHSGPFRARLENRQFVGHLSRVAEGNFGGFFGWPNLSVRNGGGYMGQPKNDVQAEMRVVDMYRREGDKLAENWIFIDMLHYLNQQGLDVLARMREVHS